MAQVIVSFYLDADDETHPTGVTNETFENVSNAVSEVGGYDVGFELLEDED